MSEENKLAEILSRNSIDTVGMFVKKYYATYNMPIYLERY